MIIIGFTGPPGAGKDTAFKILEALVSQEWDIRRYSFADPIREIAERMMSLPSNGHAFWDAKLKDQQLEEFNFNTPREMLIDLGMLGRKYRPGIWLDLAVDQIFDDGPDVAVITDVRFLNEAQRVRSLSGELIDIERPGFEYDAARQSESGEASHLATRRLRNTTMGAFQHAVEDAWWRIIADRGGVK
jgi:hypothetical protein